MNLFSEHVNMKKGGDAKRHWGVGNNLDLLHMPESPSLEKRKKMSNKGLNGTNLKLYDKI